jgi:hypothetical protein
MELAYASPVVSQHVLEDMGADMTSLHRHDRKKNLPRALNDEAGKPGNDGRKRRSNGSSDDEGKIAEDGFSNEDLRVGGPYLCSIPMSSRPVPETIPAHEVLWHKASSGKHISEHIHQTLHNRNIDLIEKGPWSHPIGLCYQQSKFNPELERVPTIVITAIRHIVDDVWLRAAREIYCFLLQENFGQISVEIMDAQARQPLRTFSVLKSDPIFNKWASVLGRILTDVDLTDIQLIGCYRRGRNSGIDNLVTVLVIVDINSKRSWRITRDVIAGILDCSNLPMVAVEIVKDRKTLPMNYYRFDQFNEEILKGRAMAGGPIAHNSNDVGSGTLGGFIGLQHPDTLGWYCFALTCFHVINPRDRDLTDRERAGELVRVRLFSNINANHVDSCRNMAEPRSLSAPNKEFWG